ncbi:AMIN-like domain-containing (lipo)protein [Pseudonocardia sp. GCM10023141]|uniref:AMIN-like domain-containing (lipo)protein n=1 Tax=Pseudonocardia sp. GCM10023141 TaxID=3252653 RepID=UPI003614C878
MKKIVGVLTAALLASLLSGATAIAAPGSCDTAWGSDLRSVLAGATAEVQQVRAGTDTCWDRVVIDLAGPASGYHVQYVDEVTREGSGAVVPVPGAAKLQINLNNPVPSTFDVNVAVDGYPTLRSVVYAGGFEGLALGVGVRARLPFRVFTLTGPDRIVVDIAHRWS